MGKLYVVDVAEDWENTTLRACRVLCEAVLIVAHKTPTIETLLAQRDVRAPLLDLASPGVTEVLRLALEALDGGDVAWISDGGVGLGEAGTAFLRGLLAQGIEVLPVPGGSALIAGLVHSGLPTDRFSYLGRLPSSLQERRDLLRQVAHEQCTLACTALAGDLASALEDVENALGDRRMVCACGWGHRAWRGRTGEAHAALASLGALPPDLDCHIYLEGAAQEQAWPEERVRAEVRSLLATGASTRDVAQAIAQRSGWRRRAVYRIAIELEGE
jgi:16S rRNA (cytidine1402-2'-O)-methyltransferase